MKIPLIPQRKLASGFREKENHFNDFFASQCPTIINNSTLSHDVTQVSNVRL